MAEDIRNMASTKGIAAFEKQYDAPHCIVLDSEYCSMGRMIGTLACQKTGYTYYDAVLLLELVKEMGVTKADLDRCEEQLRRRKMTRDEIQANPLFCRLEEAFDRAIDIALSKGPCLIHDRITKADVLKKGYSCVAVQTFGLNIDDKIVRAKLSPIYAHLTDKEEIIAKIQEEDTIRINTHIAHSTTRWGDKNIYDLTINVDQFGRDYSSELLAATMKRM